MAWGHLKEKVKQKVIVTGRDAAFIGTSDEWNYRMLQEAQAFNKTLKACEESILKMHKAAEGMMKTSQKALNAPLPQVWDKDPNNPMKAMPLSMLRQLDLEGGVEPGSSLQGTSSISKTEVLEPPMSDTAAKEAAYMAGNDVSSLQSTPEKAPMSTTSSIVNEERGTKMGDASNLRPSGGSGVHVDKLEALSSKAGSRLHREVLEPMRAWRMRYKAIKNKVAALEPKRLDVDIVRRKYLHAEMKKVKSMQSSSTVPEHLTRDLEDRKAAFEAAQGQYNLVEREAHNELAKLVEDCVQIREIIASALMVESAALRDAVAIAEDVEPSQFGSGLSTTSASSTLSGSVGAPNTPGRVPTFLYHDYFTETPNGISDVPMPHRVNMRRLSFC